LSKKILLTGSDGFLAQSIQSKITSNYEITAFNRTELDLDDTKAVENELKSKEYDIIIHCATYDAAPKNSPKDSQFVLERNLKMFFNLVRCENYFEKLIYFGSGAEFGRLNWGKNMNEDYFDNYVPNDQYGLSKYIMTKYALKSKKIFNLRLFGVFGELEDWRYRFISNACCHAIYDMPININQNALFDFLYIDDLVQILQWYIDNNSVNNVVNVCTGKAIDYVSLAEKIINISQKDLNIIIKNKGFRVEYSGNNSLLLSEIGGFDFTSIDESLYKMYSWYEKHKNNIDPSMFHF